MAAAVAVAREHGLRVDGPVVLHDMSNVLVHLRPAPVVARVATATGVYRPGATSLRLEVAVGLHLAAAGAPAVAPTDVLPPGPHSHGGLVLSFWEHVDGSPDTVEPAAAGVALREVHEAPASFEHSDLEPFARPREAIRIAATLDEAALLVPAAERALAEVEALDLPLRPLHGDAHVRNVLGAARGPVWIDLEDTFLGPLGWDLACLVTQGREFGQAAAPGEAALDAYGGERDIDALVRLRALQIAVWTVARADRFPPLRARADAALLRVRG